MNITLPPKLKLWIEERVKEGYYENQNEVIVDVLRQSLRQSAVGLVNKSQGSEADIGALVYSVMIEAAKDSSEDLKAIMDDVKSITAAKRKMRELIRKIQHDVSANLKPDNQNAPLRFTEAGLGSERAYHKAPVPVADPLTQGGVVLVPTDLWPEKVVSVETLESILDSLKNKLDSMSELSEMESIRLQMVLDRRSKLFSTLSNILKKMSDTQDSIVQNIK